MSRAAFSRAALASAKALAVLSLGELLGYIVVHELGHLLLGKDSHSSEGVMRPVWQFEDLQQAARGRLGFTLSQVEQMRGRYLSASLQRSAPLAPGQQQPGNYERPLR